MWTKNLVPSYGRQLELLILCYFLVKPVTYLQRFISNLERYSGISMWYHKVLHGQVRIFRYILVVATTNRSRVNRLLVHCH